MKQKHIESKIEEFEKRFRKEISCIQDIAVIPLTDNIKSFFRIALSSTWDISKKVGREEVMKVVEEVSYSYKGDGLKGSRDFFYQQMYRDILTRLKSEK